MTIFVCLCVGQFLNIEEAKERKKEEDKEARQRIKRRRSSPKTTTFVAAYWVKSNFLDFLGICNISSERARWGRKEKKGKQEE